MKKLKKVLIVISFILFAVDAFVIIYYSFIKKETKYTFNASLKVESDYQFVLSNINKEVEEYDVNDYSPNYEVNKEINNPIKIDKDEALSFNNVETILYPLVKKDNCLYVMLSLANTHDIDIVFISSNATAYKYKLRSTGDSINRIIDYKELDKGRYHIYIIDNEEKYDTMQTITIN